MTLEKTEFNEKADWIGELYKKIGIAIKWKLKVYYDDGTNIEKFEKVQLFVLKNRNNLKLSSIMKNSSLSWEKYMLNKLIS